MLRRTVLATAAAALALTAAPASASQFNAAPGGVLQLTDSGSSGELVAYRYETGANKLVFFGAAITNPNGVAGCTLVMGNWECTGFTGLLIDLGAGEDTITTTFGLNEDPPFKPELHGGDGDDNIVGGPGDEALFGDGGADRLIGAAGPDQLSGGAGVDEAAYIDKTATVTATIGGSGGEAGEGDTIGADVEDLTGGDGDDVLTGDGNANALRGDDGKDTLEGLGGVDLHEGGDGDDVLKTRDGADERVACGSGNDSATTDLHDLRDSCESVDESGALEPDADRDGYAKFRPDGKPAPDCNDNDPEVRPGRDEVFGNGKDDNCDQIVDRSLDVDGDGFRVPLDCNDGNPAIRPLATEIVGNTIDENCDGIPEPLPSLRPTIDARWDIRGFRTINRRMTAEDLEAGSTIKMTCRGNKCPFKAKTWNVRTARKRMSLRSPLKNKRLRPRVKIEIEISKPGRISKIVRYRMGSREYPLSEVLCRTLPGAGPRKNCAA